MNDCESTHQRNSSEQVTTGRRNLEEFSSETADTLSQRGFHDEHLPQKQISKVCSLVSRSEFLGVSATACFLQLVALERL